MSKANSPQCSVIQTGSFPSKANFSTHFRTYFQHQNSVALESRLSLQCPHWHLQYFINRLRICIKQYNMWNIFLLDKVIYHEFTGTALWYLWARMEDAIPSSSSVSFPSSSSSLVRSCRVIEILFKKIFLARTFLQRRSRRELAFVHV